MRGIEEQHRVLDLAAQQCDARQVLPDISLPAVGADDAAWAAWRERLRARSTRVLGEEHQRVQVLGIIDEHWNVLAEELPGDMQASLKSSVET